MGSFFYRFAPVTLTLTWWPSYMNLTHIPSRNMGCAKINFLRQSFWKLSSTGHTDTTEIIYHATLRVVKQTEQVVNSSWLFHCNWLQYSYLLLDIIVYLHVCLWINSYKCQWGQKISQIFVLMLTHTQPLLVQHAHNITVLMHIVMTHPLLAMK